MATSDLEEPLIPFDEESNDSGAANSPSAKSFFPLALKVFFMMAITISVVYLVVTVSDANVMSGSEFRKNTGDSTDWPSMPVVYYNTSVEFRMAQDTAYRYVLLFSDFYDDDRNWYLGTNLIKDSYFEDLKCPETKCIVTSNRTYLPGGVSSFDSLLFFAHNKWDLKEFPPPQSRRPEQIYVVGMLETPPHTWRTFEKDWGYFNWSMSFRFESDVFWPYGYFVEQNTDKVITPAQDPVWRQRDPDHYERPFFHNETMLRVIKKKRKMAAWFVSNCNLTPSNRMSVAKQMGKFVTVDIYGKCGTKTCMKDKHEECQQMLEQDYMFYLSFENSLCRDYLTEKVFSNMNYLIIPVLYNAAENHKFLPPNSYLNVLDYGSIKELTDHMQFLASHPEEYIKYFWWKEFYYVRSGYSFCDLCVKLHEQHVTERRQYYQDLDAWYRNGACIAAPKIPLQ